MEKAIFLDRDGTINKDFGYVHSNDQFELLPGVITGLKKLQKAGFLLIIITNQSGIARGLFSEQQFLQFDTWVREYLKKYQINIEKTYYCPHHPDARIPQYKTKCDCRKPGTLLFRKAIDEYDIDISKSYVIGDKERDIQICFQQDIKGFLIYSDKEMVRGNVMHIHGGLLEATNCILGG